MSTSARGAVNKLHPVNLRNLRVRSRILELRTGPLGFAARLRGLSFQNAVEAGNHKKLRNLADLSAASRKPVLSRISPLEVETERLWLPGMDSNHDKNNLRGMCKLQTLQWSKMPHWTRKTNTRTQLVHGIVVVALRESALSGRLRWVRTETGTRPVSNNEGGIGRMAADQKLNRRYRASCCFRKSAIME